MKNKDMIDGSPHKRSCFFIFSDTKIPEIHGIVPVSSQYKKFKRIEQGKIEKYGRCNTIRFRMVLVTRIFKSVTGFTIAEYLTICRIRKAKVMLQATNMNITEIAAESGFGNITYFEKVFKKMADCSPLQYR